jgi:hypothetical protein
VRQWWPGHGHPHWPCAENHSKRRGADELWFNPGDGNVYFAIGTPGLLGVVDAGSLRVLTTNLPTQSGSHSVAAYVGKPNQILVPLTSTGIQVFVSGSHGNEDDD